MTEFRAWPKTPRLFRDMVITEKIDGTNAAVVVEASTRYAGTSYEGYLADPAVVQVGDDWFKVSAQSRKRLIVPGNDNYGFAAWVRDHQAGLAAVLGEGYHYGEWWGSGIQRGYGLTKGERRFSLFNVNRYVPDDLAASGVPGLDVVPLLARYTFDTWLVVDAMQRLAEHGSWAAPGFDRPEGIVVFHSASGATFKALLENDDQPKGQVAA